MRPHLTHAHLLWKQLVLPGDRVIDATVGNGHDLQYLAQLLNGEGELIGYDIQSQALLNTKQRLNSLLPSQRKIISLKQQSHASFEEKSAKLIVYNLGYLPGEDKSVTTLSETTRLSVQHALEIIQKNGAISITCYPGHEEGAKEQTELLSFLEELPAIKWQICHYRWINRRHSPTLIWIQPVSPYP